MINNTKNGGMLMPQSSAFPDVGSLSASHISVAFHRLELLGSLLKESTLTTNALEHQAQTTRVSSRTLRRYHATYQQAGLAGLAPHARSDRHSCHTISSTMMQQIETLRLSHRDAPLRHVYTLACAWAESHEEKTPSLWQVRAVCRRILPAVLTLADGREAEFRITYPIYHDPHQMIWQLDHREPLPVFIKHGSQEIRPYLTLIVDSASRVIMGTAFSLTKPDRFVVATALRTALLITDDKPYGGVPQALWIDNAKELLSTHVRQLVTGLGIDLVPGPPYRPEIRGIVERMHRTLETQLRATLPGYCGPNVVARHPDVHAVFTLEELIRHFQQFVEHYHATGGDEAPLARWHSQVIPVPVNPRLLDILLSEPLSRRILKSGIKFNGRLYWDAAFAPYVGQEVTIRVPSSPPEPPTIDVYVGERWIASATPVVPGSVPRLVVAEAQRTQRRETRRQIREAQTREASPDPSPISEPTSSAHRAHQILDQITQRHMGWRTGFDAIEKRRHV
jgi:putative transposase